MNEFAGSCGRGNVSRPRFLDELDPLHEKVGKRESIRFCVGIIEVLLMS